MKPTRLFHRNFTLMIIGQIISLFGNSILRFALSLYVLDKTGNAAVFGGILALSMVPTVLFSPLGGVLADRVPRQRIMAALDFIAAIVVGGYTLLFGAHAAIPVVGVLMVLLSVIQAFYQPSVQASIPALTADEHLMQANGVVVQVQAFATLLGPILAGILYGWVGLMPMMTVSALCFFASAVMELFLRIPFVSQVRVGSALTQIKSDLGGAFHFLRRDNPKLFRMLFVIAGLNLFLSALFIVGLPYLVKLYLGLSSQHYGFAEAALSLGSILGGLLSGIVAKRVGFHRAHRFLLGTALLLLPMALVLGLHLPTLLCYGVIVVCVLMGMCCATLFNISAQTFCQQQTPPNMLGKVASFISAICVCALPLGQAMYGGLLQLFQSQVWVVLLFGMVTSLVLALCAGRSLSGLKVETAAPVDEPAA